MARPKASKTPHPHRGKTASASAAVPTSGPAHSANLATPEAQSGHLPEVAPAKQFGNGADNGLKPMAAELAAKVKELVRLAQEQGYLT